MITARFGNSVHELVTVAYIARATEICHTVWLIGNGSENPTPFESNLNQVSSFEASWMIGKRTCHAIDGHVL